MTTAELCAWGIPSVLVPLPTAAADHQTANARALERAGATPVAVRYAHELADVDALVLPGGESTTIGKLLTRFGLLGPLTERARAGMPLYGTCAGAIAPWSRMIARTD